MQNLQQYPSNPVPGPIFLLHPHHFLPRSSFEPQYRQPAPPPPPPSSPPPPPPPAPQPKEVTNSKARNYKEKCISHFIEGQLIIETTGPPTERKPKVKKEKKISTNKIRSEMPKWSVADVVQFIKRHENIAAYASYFEEHEVDGEALLYMIDNEEELKTLTANFKHGPAVKIKITLLKYRQQQQPQQ